MPASNGSDNLADSRETPMLHKGFGLKQRLRPEDMTSFLTPESDLFSVWHLGIPDVATDTWSLTIGGRVRRRLVLSLDDLHNLPQTEITSVHECAGSPLAPAVPQRRVGNVRWRGVALSELLGRAGIEEGSAFIISTGCDHGVFDSTYHERYEKDLPLAKALDGDTLVALTINGSAVPVRRGGPVRLVVPGYYGTNSTKWLTSLTASDRRSAGAFTTKYYMDPPQEGSSAPTPVWDLAPNSCIVAPVDGHVRVRRPVTVWGWAWGSEPVTAVDVSVDGGHTWAPAEVEPRTGHAWQKFTLTWAPSAVGEHVLACRATTGTGATQPSTPRRNRIHQRVIFVTQEE
ncbi:molybdopterin-dependent oxidoreductase [Streptomyces sp. FXJ1.172]|uniref:molybdopterin-dependent oxidoreductase n=1 Tax=Streptomyces sp. FXJ1.172 TaxID=710705 RepID=UPI001331191E|nr:molybdopterin-dependent oxidoreductase [Streptomyces sp. FXJ1.172]WEO93444.1 molybdopterin-dependent oxidoreductase [Streptomyces sp. FXJ1.172]